MKKIPSIFLALFFSALALLLAIGQSNDGTHEVTVEESSGASSYKSFNWSQGKLIIPAAGIFTSYRPPQGSEKTIFSLIYQIDWKGTQLSFQLFGDQYHVDQSVYDFLTEFTPIEEQSEIQFFHISQYNKNQFLRRLFEEAGPAGQRPVFGISEWLFVYKGDRPYPIIYSPVFEKLFLVVVRDDTLVFEAHIPSELEPDLPEILLHIQTLINTWKRGNEAEIK